MSEGLVEVALPQVGWLQNMHIAIEHFEAILGHIFLKLVTEFFDMFLTTRP